MNNGKYHTEQYKQKQAEKTDRLYGPVKTHTKLCETCNKPFIFHGREHTKTYQRARFCCKSCANSVGGIAKRDKMIDEGTATYRTICFTVHSKQCIICGEDKIVEVHHYDHNHHNNKPNNLVPLCPTHHQYVHSRYQHLVQPVIDSWIQRKQQ